MKNQIAIFLSLILFACDGLEIEQKIVDNYYIVKAEGVTNVSYKLDNDGYIGRTPDNVKQYGFNRRYVVAKIQNPNKTYSFYIIDREKDSELADEKHFRFGPISEAYYKEVFEKKLDIEFHDVEE